MYEGKRRGRIRNAHRKRKGESEMRLNTGLLKIYSIEGTQNKNSIPLKCKSAKCYNEHFKYKTKECLELHDKLHHSQQGREKKELKERKYITVFLVREHRCWNRRRHLR